MNRVLADEALALAAVVRDQVLAAGGVDLLRSAVRRPENRDKINSIFDAAGVWGLQPLDDGLELEAAAAICEISGEFALPYPVVERLTRDRHDCPTLLVPTAAKRCIGVHVDYDWAWSAVDLTGQSYEVIGRGQSLFGTRIAPLAGEVFIRPRAEQQPRLAALGVTLQCWWLVGLLRKALADTIKYSGERNQFGRPLRAFQAVAFGIADMTVAVEGLEEMAKYTLWSVREDDHGSSALVDSLALRTIALEASDIVLRGAHQYHGAMGFTDEVDISWLSLASQLPRRLPETESATRDLLASMISASEFEVMRRGRTSAAVEGESLVSG